MPEPTPRPTLPKRLVLCLDGTWANPAKKKLRDDGDEVFKPSNVLKTARAVRDFDDAAGVLVLTGRPADGDTVTLDGKTYTFQTTLTPGDGHVRIGADAGETLAHLADAINEGVGTDSGEGTTVHPSVRARAVRGDRSSLEIVPRPEASGDGPFTGSATLAAGRWVARSGWLECCRRRGLDPCRGAAQIAYYDPGVGALRNFPGLANRVHRTVDSTFGGAAGAGFEGNIEDAYLFLALNYREGDEIYIFGFSRGASTARGLAQFIDWMGGITPARDAYWVPRYFDAFLSGGSYRETYAAIVREREQRRIARGFSLDKAREAALRIAGTVTPARIRFLGVWDTVLSLGKKREAPHVKPEPPAAVDHARQALAIDERRAAFKPRIWRRRSPSNPAQTLEQRWFAGVHTNIGGGYVHDGLANQALRWMLGEAREAGLALDWDFLSFYRPYPFDQLYDSSKLHWRVLQTVTFRRKKGIREIWTAPEAGLEIHPSVFQRMAQEPEAAHPRLEKYRPKNLEKYLDSLPDRGAALRAQALAEEPG